MDNVLTLVAASPGHLHFGLVTRVTHALNARGIKCGTADWLAENWAVDIPLLGQLDIILSIGRETLKGIPVDLHAQGVENRRKKLLFADMDSTIITSETLDDLSHYAGVKNQVSEITHLAMRGQLDFEQALHDRVAMLKGLSESRLSETYEGVEITPGAIPLVATMARNGGHCVLISGGFSYFSSRVAVRCKFHEHHANKLDLKNGILTGKVEGRIVTKDVKLDTLIAKIRELDLSTTDTAAVGDGANDLPMIQAAGLGVAFHGKPIVADNAPAKIEHGDLNAMLFYQGYRLEEFVFDGSNATPRDPTSNTFA